jgi:hypothetical protein
MIIESEEIISSETMSKMEILNDKYKYKNI